MLLAMMLEDVLLDAGYRVLKAARLPNALELVASEPIDVAILDINLAGKEGDKVQKGQLLLQIDKDSAQPRARVDLGKEKEPVYAVDDIAGMLFLRTAPGTVVGYRL